VQTVRRREGEVQAKASKRPLLRSDSDEMSVWMFYPCCYKATTYIYKADPLDCVEILRPDLGILQVRHGV